MATWIKGIMAALLTLGLASGAMAAGSSSSSTSQSAASKLDKAEDAIEAGDYQQAIPLLQDVIDADSDNADAYNYLGFAHRKLGNLEKSKRYYDQALAIDPDHKGANEYLGELYLRLGDLGKAEERLAKLDQVCTYGCEEYEELKAAIERYRSEQQG